MSIQRTKFLSPALGALAIAALAVIVLAVALTAGGAQAQTAPATPEACPAEDQTAAVVNSGQYALFDVYWNPVEKELTNSICPPSVVHVPAQTGPGGHPARDDRTPSSINITAEPPTIIHIPSSAKVNLNEAGTPYTQAHYQDLWDADNEENRDAEGDYTPGMGDGFVWALPACPTDGSTFNGLCLSFSAALLNSADWVDNTRPAEQNVIEYHLDHVHQTDIDRQESRYTLAYDPSVTDPDTGGPTLYWDSTDAQVAVMEVAPGEYERPMWFFTSRGTYDFQVHIQGYPDTEKDNPLSKLESSTSDQRRYIVHVGAEADLSATMRVTPQNPSPTNEVTITITASNAGPDEAQKTKVAVTLPEGLTLSTSTAPQASAGTYAAGVWTIDDFDDGASATLTITATVDADTRGQDLTVDATISATEPVKITERVKNAEGDYVERVKTYHVPVPDPTPGNNTATGTVTVPSSTNANPIFGLERHVAENSPADTYVGPVVVVKEQNEGETLHFNLVGNGNDNFTVSQVHWGAQIAVAQGADLDYECRNHYPLTLQVSDHKDEDGNPDMAVDDTIPLDINISDVSDNPTLTLTAPSGTQNGGASVEFRATASPVPDCEWTYKFFLGHPGGDYDVLPYETNTSGVFWYEAAEITVKFKVVMSRTIPSGQLLEITSNEVEVTWQ